MKLSTILISIVLALGAGSASAGTRFADVALSPDGTLVATIEARTGVANADHPAIVIRAVRSGRELQRLDPCLICTYSSPAWGRGNMLAFVAREAAGRRTSVYLMRGRIARRVADFEGLATAPRLSPDGTRLAVLVTEGAAKEVGATQAGRRQVGEIGAIADEQRIVIIDELAEGKPARTRMLTPQDRYVYEFCWAPDGRTLVATSARGDGDANWWVASLDAFDVTSGRRRQILAGSSQMRFPVISPDGSQVAFVGGLMSDYSEAGGDIWTVPFGGGTPVNRTKGSTYTTSFVEWTSGGLRAVTQAGSAASIGTFGFERGLARTWTRQASFASAHGPVAFSADGTVAATVMQNFTSAPEIYAGPIAALRRITSANTDQAPLVRARNVVWQSDGRSVQGWLLEPVTRQPGESAALIVNVHGGPANMWLPNFIARGGITAALVENGYDVFLPNPRGSYGAGEAFTAANRRDFGGGDLRDILAGVDAVQRAVPIDPARIGLMGRSYGGYMAMWANTQTSRFAAIVAIAGISNWISLYGTNGINEWMIPYFGVSMYRDPEAYSRISPLTHVLKAKTPTLIYVGERDIEVPATQSLEYWRALKDQGVETSLVIYPDEGHELRGTDNASDSRRRTVAWFDKFLGRSTAGEAAPSQAGNSR